MSNNFVYLLICLKGGHNLNSLIINTNQFTHCFSLRSKGVRGKNLSDRACFLKKTFGFL